MSVGSNIKKYRKKSGLSGSQLGGMIGISQSNIARYENGGVKYISTEILERIANALSCKVSDLTAGDDRYETASKSISKRKPSNDDYLILEKYHSLTPDLRNIVDMIFKLNSTD